MRPFLHVAEAVVVIGGVLMPAVTKDASATCREDLAKATDYNNLRDKGETEDEVGLRILTETKQKDQDYALEVIHRMGILHIVFQNKEADRLGALRYQIIVACIRRIIGKDEANANR